MLAPHKSPSNDSLRSRKWQANRKERSISVKSRPRVCWASRCKKLLHSLWHGLTRSKLAQVCVSHHRNIWSKVRRRYRWRRREWVVQSRQCRRSTVSWIIRWGHHSTWTHFRRRRGTIIISSWIQIKLKICQVRGNCNRLSIRSNHSRFSTTRSWDKKSSNAWKKMRYTQQEKHPLRCQPIQTRVSRNNWTTLLIHMLLRTNS